MLKKLRRRITGMLTLLTGVILAAALGLSLWLGIRQTKEEHTLYFEAAMVNALEAINRVDFENPENNVYVERAPYAVKIEAYESTGLFEKDGVMQMQKTSVGLFKIEERVSLRTGREKLFAKVKEASDYASLSGEAYYSSFYGGQDQDTMLAQSAAQEEYFSSAGETEQASLVQTPIVINEDVVVGFSAAGSSALYGEDVVQGDYGEAYRTLFYDIWPQALMGSAGSVTIMENILSEEEAQEYHEESNRIMRTGFEITIVGGFEAENAAITRLVLTFSGIFLAGLALLALASWFLAGVVIKPVAEGVQKRAEFMAAASHELRTPLAVITSSLSAADGEPEEDEAAKYYHTAKEEAQRMGRLVGDMLTLARSDSDRWDVNLQEIELDTLLIETNEQFVPLAKQKKRKLVLELPQQMLPAVQGDANRLRQALTVLVDNALQYTPQQGTVTIAARAGRHKIEIDVADEGIGIPDDEKGKVFERFYRADKSRSDENHFGLGLSIAKELCELNNATLTVHNAPEGGALFRISLPIKQNKNNKGK